MSPTHRQAVPPPSLEEFVAAPGLTLIELWVGWSGEAFLVGAAIDRLVRLRSDLRLRIGRVDLDVHPEIGARFHSVAPALLLFRDGQAIARHRGLVTVDALSSWLDDAVRASAPSNPDPSIPDESER